MPDLPNTKHIFDKLVRGDTLNALEKTTLWGLIGPALVDATTMDVGTLNVSTALNLTGGLRGVDGNSPIPCDTALKFQAETVDAGGEETALDLGYGSYDIDSDAGGDLFTLADGASGEIKTIVQKSSTGTSTVTPANFSAGTSITMDTAGQTVVLQFMNGSWHIIGGYGYTVI